MTDNTELRQNIEKLSDNEISTRISRGYYSDQAISIASNVLRERGVPVPAVNPDYKEDKVPFYKAHPIWFLTLSSLAITILVKLIKQLMQ